MSSKEFLTKKSIMIAGAAIMLVAVILLIVLLSKQCSRTETPEEEAVEESNTLYGIECKGYDVVHGEVRDGETLSHLLGNLGISPAMIDRVDRESRPVYNMRNIRSGQPYTVFMTLDSLQGRVCHFVYEKNATDYVVLSFDDQDKFSIREDCKEITTVRRKETAKIHSSLWNAIVSKGIPIQVFSKMEDIFGWSVDFFALQEEDEFTVIFEEQWVDTVRVGTGMIWGAEFKHNGKLYRAIPFEDDGKLAYWDENGNSMRRQFLKAPLQYTRISSKFSNGRLHPIYKVVRPHHGIDYAAPMGTPVVAISEGTVIEKRWDGRGGGNMLKIKHPNNYVSGYLHLKGYAKGISVGTRVSQGQNIAYVGSTGSSTGPHLDFRIWKGGKAINPLAVPSDPMVPISDKNRESFNYIKNKVIAELTGDVPEADKITSLDHNRDSLSTTSSQTTTAGVKTLR